MSLPVLLYERFVSQKQNIFDVVICLVIALSLLLGLPGVNALDDA